MKGSAELATQMLAVMAEQASRDRKQADANAFLYARGCVYRVPKLEAQIAALREELVEAFVSGAVQSNGAGWSEEERDEEARLYAERIFRQTLTDSPIPRR
jgi:hypothetical protein